MSAPGTILVGCFGDAAWIRVEGEASHRNSARVRDFGRCRIDKGTRHFILDLEKCGGMDSTFMGTLTSLALDLKRLETPGRVDILNASERNIKALNKLGLQAILRIDTEGTAWTELRDLVAENVAKPLPAEDLDRRERVEMVMEAHEALVRANSENFTKFQDVLEYLKRDLESQSV